MGFQTPQHKLVDLLNWAQSGKLQLPDFQRCYKMGRERIQSLLVTVVLGYPLGVVMLLRTGNDQVRFEPKPLEGSGVPVGVQPSLLLLDGQHGLTSLPSAQRRWRGCDQGRSRHRRRTCVEFGVYGDGFVVSVGEPVLGEDHCGGGDGAVSGLTEDLAGKDAVGSSLARRSPSWARHEAVAIAARSHSRLATGTAVGWPKATLRIQASARDVRLVDGTGCVTVCLRPAVYRVRRTRPRRRAGGGTA
jgi:hypothetical protein